MQYCVMFEDGTWTVLTLEVWLHPNTTREMGFSVSLSENLATSVQQQNITIEKVALGPLLPFHIIHVK
jgi:hypothetical protein